MSPRLLASLFILCAGALSACDSKSSAAASSAASVPAASASSEAAHVTITTSAVAKADMPNVKCAVSTRDGSLALANATLDPASGVLAAQFFIREDEAGHLRLIPITSAELVQLAHADVNARQSSQGAIPLLSPLATWYHERHDLQSLQERVLSVEALFVGDSDLQVRAGDGMKLSEGNVLREASSANPLQEKNLDVGKDMILRFDAPFLTKEGRESVTSASLECELL